MTEIVDLVVIGGGTGIFAASRATKFGLKVVIVENRKIGGVCLNWGGLATKTLTSTVELFRNILKANNYGIKGSVSLDWKDMKKYKDSLCTRISKIPEFTLKKAGVEIKLGQAKIIDPTTVKITSNPPLPPHHISAPAINFLSPALIIQVTSAVWKLPINGVKN